MRYGPLFFETIYGAEDTAWTPYMTRFGIGRLRCHVFHRGDADPDHHDHPNDFITFPLTSYVEEIPLYPVEETPPGSPILTTFRIVRAFRFHYRTAEFAHRVLGRYAGDHAYLTASRADTPWGWGALPLVDQRKILTLVWFRPKRRDWGFHRLRDACFIPWKRYVYGEGKSAPCQD